MFWQFTYKKAVWVEILIVQADVPLKLYCEMLYRMAHYWT